MNGFVSEFLLYAGLLTGIKTSSFYLSTLMMLALAGLAIIGGMSLLTFTKSFGVIFLGNARAPVAHKFPQEVSLFMRVPQYLILSVMLSIGLFPQLYLGAIAHITDAALPLMQTAGVETGALVLARIGRYSMVFLGLLALTFLLRSRLVSVRPSTTATTWGCAYIAPNNRMQYTGKSFSKTLGKLLGFIVGEKTVCRDQAG
ncbi:MAG: hypothetical protein IPM81_10885 [Saprospirales bacterium]|nr:hypothetical protein [Saprospirales bacterium]